jgi:glycosyltransferase involved in cell wall biosynthesis
MPEWFYRRQDASLVVDGQVEDSMDYQSDKAILIVPLLSGGGLRVKIIEGMALGKTIISTTVGARGIVYKDGENLLIADSKEAFAVQIGKCFGSKAFCREIGSGAAQLARREYDCTSTARRMVSYFEHLIKR